MIISVFLLLGSILYVSAILALYIGLQRLSNSAQHSDKLFVSVIVPARNEEKNIIKCLSSLAEQTYPKSLFEIIVLDDNSEDQTFHLAEEFSRAHDNFRVISLPEPPKHRSPKKVALEAGIEHSRGDIIFTTDADCVVQPQWIETMVRHFDEKTGAVLSWLKVRPGKKLLSRLESLDSMALSFVGAAAVGLGKPALANGANFAYRKSVFRELGGFSGIDQYASGDDDLFLQKLSRQKKWRVAFAIEPEACVTSGATENLKTFFSQRFRWASKGPLYPPALFAIEMLLYFYFFALAVTLPFSFTALFPTAIPLVVFMIKIGADYLFVKKGSQFLNARIPFFIFLLTEVFQIFYILIVGIGGSVGKFQWKGRTFARGKVLAN
ncbi:MAG: glycosyltransferase [Calditrichaeota bacterium]|nr:glycosyltransferase [Calditrichota bacterium]